MQVFHTIAEVVQWRTTQMPDRQLKSIGFIPTMGALHNGHATLIKQSIKENEYTVVSVFVNPSQFAPNEDLDKYPRTLVEDTKLLESLGVDVLFTPPPSEMFPQGIPLDVTKQRGPFVTVLGVSEMLEGKTRPNFFRGVTTVVTKLLNIVSPDVAYFGQKDVQQVIVLTVMVKELFMNTRLQMVPIVRDENGLALSSRNKFLSPETIEISSNLYRGIKAAQDVIQNSNENGSIERQILLDAINDVWAPFIKTGDFIVDYISIADWDTLHELETIDKKIQKESSKVVISCAINVKDRRDPSIAVRLIDNIVVPL